MSIDINWEKATTGPDGEALAERIRAFVHDRFQQVALPRFIRSVQVHSFGFGSKPPDLEIKDICDPFTEFYEEDENDDASDASEELPLEQQSQWHGAGGPDFGEHGFSDDHLDIDRRSLRLRLDGDPPLSDMRSPIAFGDYLNSHLLPRAGTPRIPGGTSNLGYHLMSLGGLSGTQTPLVAVAGGSTFTNDWPESVTDHRFGTLKIGEDGDETARLKKHSEAEVDNSSSSRPSTANTQPSHPSLGPGGSSVNLVTGDLTAGFSDPSTPRQDGEHSHLNMPNIGIPAPSPRRMRERRSEDFQVICRVKYAGDVKLSLTAEILLDYPMPSFVGLPLKLNITGLTFDGVAVLAYIRRRVHFSFLSPENADTLVGADNRSQEGDFALPNSGAGKASASRTPIGSLLQHIQVESEIGRKENGKQALKNVGKVERFVLDRVRQIFEEELVFPSFWTFLI